MKKAKKKNKSGKEELNLKQEKSKQIWRPFLIN